MSYLTLRGKVEWRVWIVGNAVFEAGIRCDIHIAGVGHLHTINHEAVFEGFKQVLAHLHAPYTIAVTLHGHILWQYLTLQLYLLGIGSLQAEDDTIFSIFWRDDRTWEEACHHTGSKLLFLTGSSWGSPFFIASSEAFLLKSRGRVLVRKYLAFIQVCPNLSLVNSFTLRIPFLSRNSI